MNDVKDEDREESNIPNDEKMPKDALTVRQFLLVEWKETKSEKNYDGQVLHI